MLKHPQITEGRIRSALPRIQSLIYPLKDKLEIASWTVGGEPVPSEKALRAKYTPFEVGGAWGALWDTCWLRFRGKIPTTWKGKEVVALVRLTPGGSEGFTAEGLIYQAGKPVRAINVHRSEVELASRAKGGEKFEFFVEAAGNASAPDGSGAKLNLPNFGGAPAFRLEQAELAVIDRAAFDYYYDFLVGVEAMEALPEVGQRRAELREALNASLNQFDDTDPSSLKPARNALRDVLSRHNGDTSHTISAIGHAHIDTAWLWPLRETIRKCARTFSTALDYMDRYPDYVFCCSQAQQYAWMKHLYPDIWERIKKAIRRGQWEPVGSMWIETDCNIPSGESLIRQILHGKRFFETELGVETKDVWIPDVFGYAASLPQIMRKARIDYFLTQKISWSQFNKFPHHTFNWEGIDGTRIFTHFPPADTYNADTGPSELAKNQKNFKDHGLATRSLLVYGYGDGGGGPSIAMLEKALRLRDFDGLPKLVQEKSLTFFQKAAADSKHTPVWVGELYLELHRGTYTTQAKNKRGNRKSEFLLRTAELFDSLSLALSPLRKESAATPKSAVYDVTSLDHSDPTSHAAALDRAWKLVLLNQFHDIIPGSSIHWVYQDSDRDYATVRELGESVVTSSLASFLPQIDTTGLSAPILVFNSLGFRRREVLSLPDGRLASVDVPPLGYTVVDERDEFLDRSDSPVHVTTTRSGIVIDNGIVRLRINNSGHLTSVFDHRSHREALTPGRPGNVFHLHEDIPNNWDAWDVDIFYKEKTKELHDVESVEVIEEGPLRAAVRIIRKFGNSRIEQQVVLHAGSARIDFPTKVDWAEDRKFLKVAFPVNVRAMHATYEIQYGHLQRPTHKNTSWDLARFEVCAQKWADLSEPGFGVALLNDCKYGYDIDGDVMRLSLLRAPISPDPLADRGKHEFTYAILPHAGDLREGRVIEEAYALNAPLLAKEIKKQKGDLPGSHSFFHVDSPSAVIESVKVAEEGGALILRLYEAHGSRGPVRLTTTLPIRKVFRADLLEKNMEPLPFKQQSVSLDLAPFQIETLKLLL